MNVEVLLYYKFTPISDPAAFCQDHRTFLRELGVRGRIYISKEGINGTVAGTPEQMDAYKTYVRGLQGFHDIDFKSEMAGFIPFAKLICKVREEIVALHAGDLDPANGGRYLSPREWRQTLESEQDVVVIDVRNNYESRIGHFKGAIQPDVENFYDFPGWLEQAEKEIPKDRKVLMYCTGGIRCEKFSVLMKQKGWEDVNQLHGGILTYAREEGGKHFLGKCFVFDDRMAVPIDPDAQDPLGLCEITGQPTDTYLNCANMECNRLFLCTPEGGEQMEGCCSEDCRASEYKRPYDPQAAHHPFRKWYHYFDDDFKKRPLRNAGAA